MHLCAPILRLPDMTMSFILQCDALDTGVGVALVQRFEDGLFQIAYAGKKLLPRDVLFCDRKRMSCISVWIKKNFRSICMRWGSFYKQIMLL